MERDCMNDLISWKERKGRKPLILYGARQVGKTWLMKEFGRRFFDFVEYLNFDEDKSLFAIFEGNIDPAHLLNSISALKGRDIAPDRTLLIFDEVQECPRALASLKYFCEEAPEYAIIAAGSFLGVALHEGTSFPVGKADMLTMYPMSFGEYLDALGENRLRSIIDSGDWDEIRPFEDRMKVLLKDYYYVGGMPEAVKCFVEDHSYVSVRRIQNSLLDFYRQDFSKHVPADVLSRLNLVWDSIPAQLSRENKKFIYGALKKGARAAEYELAIQWLCDCGLTYKVHNISKPGIPLKMYMDSNAFKLYFLDVGLLAAMSNLDSSALVNGNRIFVEFKGALTEQFVLQQLLAEYDFTIAYYSAENARCEVDFIVDNGVRIIPIEVKAEENLRAKSLRVFTDKYAVLNAVRLSMSGYREQDWMTNVPLYMSWGKQLGMK